MTFGLDIDPLILLAATLLVAGILVVGLADRLRLPAALLALGLGIVVGSDVLGWVFVDDFELVRDLSVVALIVILFEGGLTTKPSALREAGLPGFVLSNVGVLITAAITALGVNLIVRGDWRTAWLIGAVVASTDAAVVFDLVRRAPLPRRLANILEVESGANDPFAIVLTIGILETFTRTPTPAEWFQFGAVQFFGGAITGVVVGVAGALLLRLRLRSDGLYPLLALGVAAAAYGAAARLGASGFLAVYISGLMVGAMVPRRRPIIRSFHTSLANGADLMLFLLLGLLVFPTQLPPVAWAGLAITAVVLFVARPVAVLVCLTLFRIPWKEQAVISWAGLRGAVPIVLATFPATAGIPAGAEIFNVVFFLVVVSLVLQATTVVPLVRLLGIETDHPAWQSIAQALPIDSTDVDLAEIHVTDDLPISGRALSEIPLGEGMVATVVVRGHRVMIPTASTRLAPEDLVLVVVDRDLANVNDVTAWARGEGIPVTGRDSLPSGDA